MCHAEPKSCNVNPLGDGRVERGSAQHIEAGTFVLDFGELRLATPIESSDQWCGWRLRFDIESKLSTVTKTSVVKDAEGRDGGGSGIARGVRSTVLAAVFIRMRNWCRTAQGYACTCALPGRCGWTVRFW